MTHIDLYCDGSIIGRKAKKKSKTPAIRRIGYAVSVVERSIRTLVVAGGQQIAQSSEDSLAELYAFEKAVDYALFASGQSDSINIYTDCQFCTQNVYKILQRKAYGAKNPYADITNPHVWRRIVEKWVLIGCRVAVLHIKGHMRGEAYHKHHAEVDIVARQAAKDHKINLRERTSAAVVDLRTIMG